MKNKITSRFVVTAGLVVGAVMALSMPLIASADTLTRQLEFGMSGSDVSSLQTFLAQDRTIYPQGLVTGYFGSLTKAAVINFQAKNGIATVGRVGPVTLAAINAQMSGGVSTAGTAPFIGGVNVAVSNVSATVNWNTNQFASGLVYYSALPLTTYEHPNSVDVNGAAAMTDTALHTTQAVSLSNLTSNTTYYYLIYTTNQAGNVSVTWPSTFHTNQ